MSVFMNAQEMLGESQNPRSTSVRFEQSEVEWQMTALRF
jgi:hypothetical protein